jgi:hypothetical protein
LWRQEIQRFILRELLDENPFTDCKKLSLKKHSFAGIKMQFGRDMIKSNLRGHSLVLVSKA